MERKLNCAVGDTFSGESDVYDGPSTSIRHVLGWICEVWKVWESDFFEMKDGLWVISFSCEIVALFAKRIESDIQCLEFRGTCQRDSFCLGPEKVKIDSWKAYRRCSYFQLPRLCKTLLPLVSQAPESTLTNTTRLYVEAEPAFRLRTRQPRSAKLRCSVATLRQHSLNASQNDPSTTPQISEMMLK